MIPLSAGSNLHPLTGVRLLLTALVGLSHAWAQGPPISTAPFAEDPLDETRLGQAIERVRTNTTLEEAARTALVATYEEALQRVQTAREDEARTAALQKVLVTAPEETRQAREELAKLGGTPEPLAAADATPEELEALIAQETAAVSDLKARLTEIATQMAALQGSEPAKVQQEIETARAAVAQAEAELASLDSAGEADPQSGAQRTLIRARIRSARSRFAFLEQDQLTRQPRLNLLTARQELFRRKAQQAEARLEALELQAVQVRQTMAAQSRLAAEMARQDASEGDPAVSDLAEKVTELSTSLQTVTTKLEELRVQRRDASRKLGDLSEKLERIRSMLRQGSADRAFAQILSEEHRNLPQTGSLRARVMDRRLEISENRARDYQLEQSRVLDREALAQLEEETRGREAVQNLLRQRDSLLDQLRDAYQNLNAGLLELSATELGYANKLDEFRNYLAGRLFWVPSSAPLSAKSGLALAKAVQRIFHPAHGATLIQTVRELGRQPWPLLLFLLLVIAPLQALRPRMIRRLEKLGTEIRRISRDHWGKTASALVLTVALALPLPLFAGFLAWAFRQVANGREMIFALSAALAWAAPILFSFSFVLQVCRPGGLGERHFVWHNSRLPLLRRCLRWWLVAYVPLMFAAIWLVLWRQADEDDTLARLLFLGGTIWTALILRWLLHPVSGVFTDYVERNPDGWTSRLKNLWVPLALLGPLALALLAVSGYFLTAVALSHRLERTAWILVGGLVAYGLAIRAFSIKERRLALAEWQQRRAAAAGEGPPGETSSGADEFAEPDDNEITLREVGEQSRHLLRFLVTVGVGVAIWLAWAGLAPAVAAEAGDSAGRIGVAEALGACLTAIVTVVVVRNLPGVLELVVLRNLPLDAGSRTAIRTLTSYALIVTGFAIAFQILELDWSRFGWIAAALSVGLGFGLQEVVANFVCGLILLFERPLRQGDVVTVGNVTGVVSRIRIRATTITDWDRKEFVVPNKEFITGTLMNWTLTNTVNRVVIQVGIAYGSDVDKARRVLLEVAAEQPEVTEDPAPSATFESFGDSSLNLTLRCFLPSLDKRLEIIHDLHTRIHQRFQEEGIEIPFPQRDIHLRSQPSLPPA